MEHYAGIDVSLELSSVCVVDTQGKIVKEAKVASDPEVTQLDLGLPRQKQIPRLQIAVDHPVIVGEL